MTSRKPRESPQLKSPVVLTFKRSRLPTQSSRLLRWRQAMRLPQLLLFLILIGSLSTLEHTRLRNETHHEIASVYSLISEDFSQTTLNTIGSQSWFQSDCRVDNSTLTDLLMEIPLGISNLPQWLRDVCPEVVDHFEKFPAFDRSYAWIDTTVVSDSGVVSTVKSKFQLPLLTTQNAVQGVCTIKMAQKIAASIEEELVLYAGSQMGALYHGQPILWDDDFDAAIQFHKRYRFLSACEQAVNITASVTLHCHRYHKGVKVWLQGPTSVKTTPRRFRHWSPFLDIFFLLSNQTHVYQTKSWKTSRQTSTTMKRSEFSPLRSYYFGGIFVTAYNEKCSTAIYGEPACILSAHNHILEEEVFPELHATDDRKLDCCRLSARFPFLYESTKIFNGQTLVHITPPSEVHESLASVSTKR